MTIDESSKVRIHIVGTCGVPARYGGFETLVENLLTELGREFDFLVYCDAEQKVANAEIPFYKRAKLVYLPLKANGISSIFYDIISLTRSLISRPDIVLVLGVSGGIFIPFFKWFSAAKIVCNVDGQEWKRAKWGIFAKTFLKMSEWFCVKFSDVVISDNRGIHSSVLENYGKDSTLIAYGGDHSIAGFDSSFAEDALFEGKYFLKVCRVEPENNIHLVLEAFKELKHNIVIVGNWQNSVYGVELFKKYQAEANILMLDPVYDPKRLFLLRENCCGYIHGHSAGGTNPSLVEMMWHSKQIFCFECVFNRETTFNRGTYFKNVTELVYQVSRYNISGALHAGVKMREIAETEYSWEIISRKYSNVFIKLARSSPK